MDVAIVGDSHVPSRADEVPEAFRERIRAADHVIHAGDFDADETLAEFRDLAADLTAVAGNMDRRLGLADVETVDLGGVRFVVTHGTGDPAGWADRVAETVRERSGDGPAVGVAGHTHRVVDEVHDGVRLLNPGSVTGALPARRPTMYAATVADGDIEVELCEP